MELGEGMSGRTGGGGSGGSGERVVVCGGGGSSPVPVALWLEVGRLTWHGGLGGRGASAFLQRGPAKLALRFLLELGGSVMLTGCGLMYASSSSREGKRLAFSRVTGLMKVADEARRCCGGAGGGAADPRHTRRSES